MADAFVIELRDLTAGIAVRERGGYRFYSSDAMFFPIDARKFRRLREIRAALRRVAAGKPLAPLAGRRRLI
ncbi:MAG: hypothetical protein ACLQJR_26750 [Stellaceae bacterium]